MMVQKGRKLGFLLAWAAAFAAVLLLGASRVEAASKLALFGFEYADDMKVAKGAKLDLTGEVKASDWKSSNPKVVKVTKKGVATALKAGKAVLSAKMNGKTEKCEVTVVKDVLKGSKSIGKAYRTWKGQDSGKKVTLKSTNLVKGLGELLAQVKQENKDDVVYKKCSKITAIEEDSAGITVYFDAIGIFNGKEASFPCVAVITDDYEHENYDYAMVLQPVTWVTNEGQLLYGAGVYWYA